MRVRACEYPSSCQFYFFLFFLMRHICNKSYIEKRIYALCISENDVFSNRALAASTAPFSSDKRKDGFICQTLEIYSYCQHSSIVQFRTEIAERDILRDLKIFPGKGDVMEAREIRLEFPFSFASVRF